MKIEKVAVLGAGAVGSYVIWGLSQKKEIRLGVIAEGERAERLKKGCRINGVTYNPEVWTPQEAQGGGSAGCMSEVWCFTGSNGQHPYGSGRKYDGNESDERSGQ